MNGNNSKYIVNNDLDYLRYNNFKRNYIIIGIFALLLCVTGATYAYFTAVASNNGIGGNAANIELKLDVKKVTSADNETGLIPMSNNMIEKAVSNSKICTDDNGKRYVRYIKLQLIILVSLVYL